MILLGILKNTKIFYTCQTILKSFS